MLKIDNVMKDNFKYKITAPVLFYFLLAANKIALSAGKCTVNGQQVPCEEAGRQIKSFLGWGLGFFAFSAAVGIAITVFWITMIVHAASHQIENKAMWIILMVFTGIIGTLTYYFVVKRKFVQQATSSTQ